MPVNPAADKAGNAASRDQVPRQSQAGVTVIVALLVHKAG
jgi:hypothetical protein